MFSRCLRWYSNSKLERILPFVIRQVVRQLIGSNLARRTTYHTIPCNSLAGFSFREQGRSLREIQIGKVGQFVTLFIGSCKWREHRQWAPRWILSFFACVCGNTIEGRCWGTCKAWLRWKLCYSWQIFELIVSLQLVCISWYSSYLWLGAGLGVR